MKISPIICDIYNGSNFYNIEKNIVRISILFDDTDNKSRIYDVPLLSNGMFKNPDFRYHKVLAFIPDGIEKRIAIADPEKTPVGSDNVSIPLGILIDVMQYKKLMGSIGNTAFHINSDVGSQNIDELDFFIPTGYAKEQIMAESTLDKEEEEAKICGVGGAKDGSVFLRGPAGEVSIGPDGIRISGKVTFADASAEKTDLTMENMTLFEILPKTIVTPFPNQLPNINKILSIAGIFTSVGNVASAIGKL